MAGSILDTLMSTLGPQVIGPLASRLGASPDVIQRGLQSGSAAMLAGLAAKADQPGFMSQIFGLLTNPAVTSTSLSSLVSSVGSGAPGGLADLGSKFMSTIFGSNISGVTDAVARTSGLAGGTASSLLSMAAPLVLGFLGHHVRDSGMSAGDLASTLKSQASGWQQYLPSGFRSLLGTQTVPPVATAVVPEAKAAARNWLWPLLLLAALLIAALWWFNRPKAPEAVQTPAVPASSFFKLTLPDGTVLNVPENGIENQLVKFINDPSRPVDSTTWFNFDRLLFDTGSATLQPSSQEQLNNIAAILKAYPNVHVKIGGYTDNVGDAASNLALSKARALNVMNAIVAAGIDPSRLESEGYGEDHPVADNSTEDGRAQNRRIALRVTAK
jgi:OOP family OmpA-OmpF porin